MRRLRALVGASALALVSWLPIAAPAPAIACTGEICDGICDTIYFLNQKLPPKLKLTDCGLR
jgi:hypothetical protein